MKSEMVSIEDGDYLETSSFNQEQKEGRIIACCFGSRDFLSTGNSFSRRSGRILREDHSSESSLFRDKRMERISCLDDFLKRKAKSR